MFKCCYQFLPLPANVVWFPIPQKAFKKLYQIEMTHFRCCLRPSCFSEDGRIVDHIYKRFGQSFFNYVRAVCKSRQALDHYGAKSYHVAIEKIEKSMSVAVASVPKKQRKGEDVDVASSIARIGRDVSKLKDLLATFSLAVAVPVVSSRNKECVSVNSIPSVSRAVGNKKQSCAKSTRSAFRDCNEGDSLDRSQSEAIVQEKKGTKCIHVTRKVARSDIAIYKEHQGYKNFQKYLDALEENERLKNGEVLYDVGVGPDYMLIASRHGILGPKSKASKGEKKCGKKTGKK
jgi:hypothetical protein